MSATAWSRTLRCVCQGAGTLLSRRRPLIRLPGWLGVCFFAREQLLQQQLMMMRATYQMNAEKLDYNFQVLKKRDEENTLTVSQQKRRFNRLQDVLSSTHARVNKQEKLFHDENTALTEVHLQRRRRRRRRSFARRRANGAADPPPSRTTSALWRT